MLEAIATTGEATSAPEAPYESYKSLSDHRLNNFDFLRFVAALMVILCHSFALLDGPNGPFADFSKYLGDFAVSIFFVISGYLITRSTEREGSIFRFVASRALRMWPALIVVTCLSVFVLGPMLTTLSQHAYWTSPETWAYFRNLSLSTIEFNLPGVFEDNPFRKAVNGSLWTLPIEVNMYMVSLVCGIVGLIRKRYAFLLLTFVMLALDMRYFSNHAYFNVTLPWLPQQALGSCFHFCILYMAGGLLYLFRAYIALEWKFAVIAVLLYLCSINTPHFHMVQFFTIPYFVIFAAHYPNQSLASFGKYGDFSYGLYIYAFPIQQLIAQNQHGKISVTLFFFESFIVTNFCAALSWHIVEQPALQLKRLLKKSTPPAALPAPQTTVELV